MAKKVKLKELPELLLEKPNVYHIRRATCARSRWAAR